MLRKIHPSAGFVGLLTIVVFWASTVAVEAFGGPQAILAVKTGILWGMIVLIPALAAAGASGLRLAGPATQGLAGAKKRRMPFIAANGILILIPCAVFLQRLAAAGDFGTAFYAVQAIEVASGAVRTSMRPHRTRCGRRCSTSRDPHRDHSIRPSRWSRCWQRTRSTMTDRGSVLGSSCATCRGLLRTER